MKAHMTIHIPSRSTQFRFALFLSISWLALAAWGDDFPRPSNTEKSTDQPMPPEEVCRTAVLPPGFELTAFAAEPDVQNPIAITTDERGRVWVAENYTWAGADAGNFDVNLRDRVVILEDTDGDGKHDQRTVFYDQASRLTSIEIGFGGVWLLCSPKLLFVPDRNRDDVPDGPPVVVLDGFDIESVSHTAANGLKWGPDGWLYGRQGILGTSKIGVPGADDSRRVTINTGVWRVHPTQRTCEAVMHGMTNPWGFDYDAFGEMFVINTVIGHLWHVIPGARTERMFGTDFNPHAYHLISQVADHVHWDTGESWTDVRKGVTDRTSAAGGGHAHTGLMIYQGDIWPAEYRSNAYTLNLHGRRLNRDILVPKPVGFTAKHSADLCFIADPWFRGMDVISSADGEAFIADWSDTGECHEIGGVHRLSGRIYKLTHGEPRDNATLDLAKLSDVELAKLQDHPNDWFTRHARRLLQERADAKSFDQAAVRNALLRIYSDDANPVHRCRAMWALSLSGCVDDDWLLNQLQDPDEHVRVWAVRLLVDLRLSAETTAWAPLVDSFITVAREDKSGLVLLYVASALQKMPAEARWSIGRELACRSETAFTDDRTLSIMLWLGIEPLVVQFPEQSLALIREAKFPLLRESVARRLTTEIDRDIETVKKLLALASDEEDVAASVLQGIAAALNGRKSAPVPANWNAVSSKLVSHGDESIRDSINVIGVIFKDHSTIDSLRRTIDDTAALPQVRRRALELLIAARQDDLYELLRRLMTDNQLASQAIRGLAHYDDPSAAGAIVAAYASLDPTAKSAAIDTLASRPSYANFLISALESKQVATTDVSAFQVRQIHSLNDPSLSDKLREIWGDVRETPEDKRTAIANLKQLLNDKRLATASSESGKELFARNCASCHLLFGEGKKLGPDLTGSNRKNVDYLLENIVDPSAVVGAEFRESVYYLVDGRVVSGVVREKNDRTITLGTPEGQEIIDLQDVEEVSMSNRSIMPDGLLQGLTDSQICELVAYIISN